MKYSVYTSEYFINQKQYENSKIKMSFSGILLRIYLEFNRKKQILFLHHKHHPISADVFLNASDSIFISCMSQKR